MPINTQNNISKIVKENNRVDSKSKSKTIETVVIDKYEDTVSERLADNYYSFSKRYIVVVRSNDEDYHLSMSKFGYGSTSIGDKVLINVSGSIINIINVSK